LCLFSSRPSQNVYKVSATIFSSRYQKLISLGYELIADACRREQDAQHLLITLKIEEHRLLNWGRLIQLDYTDKHLVLNHMSRGKIMDVLDQQRTVLTSFGRLDRRYDLLRKPLLQAVTEIFEIDSDHVLENSGSISESSNQAIQFPPAEELVKKALDWLNQSRDVPKRIIWVAWDHEKMENLIVKLSDYNNNMYDALDRAQKETFLDMQIHTNYQIVLLNRHMENMVQIWQSERIAYRPQGGMIMGLEDSDYGLLNSSAGPSHRSLTQPLCALAQQKFVHLAIEGSRYVSEERGKSIGLPHLADNIRATELNVDDIQIIDNEPFPDVIEEGDRTEAIYDGASVWIEWKPNGAWMLDGDLDLKIRSCVQKLAALLKQKNRIVHYRVPHCLGYFIDESEDRGIYFGLVFKKPSTVPFNSSPTTLRQLIEASYIPSLADRINLMYLLAETVQRLHAVNWLHKELRSVNILFFQKRRDDGTSVELDFDNPYISGFGYSRPVMREDMTVRPTYDAWANIYRHPTVQSNGNCEDATSTHDSYKKSFDLYSLGILFLEIAHWKTIDQILDIDLNEATPKQTWRVRKRLLTHEPQHLRLVKSYSGNTVEEVVRSCLVGPEAFGLKKGCDERRGVVAAALHKAFGERVVRRLGGTKGLKD
jgi:hypothetical protein